MTPERLHLVDPTSAEQPRPRPGAGTARSRDRPEGRSTAGDLPGRRDERARDLVALMARVQHGDQDAFRDLYDHSVPIAHAVAVRTTRSPEHAAEVVQEVYLHVWQHAADFVPERGSVLGWMLMLVHRRAVDRVRSVTSSNLRDQRDADRAAATVPDVAELGLARLDALALRRAVGRLSSKQRDAVTLTYLQGLTVREAAVRLGIPGGTVKTRVRDGITALRGHLGADAA